MSNQQSHPGNTSAAGYDEERLSASKIAPLDSSVKSHQRHDDTHGVIGHDEVMEHAHIPPFPEHAQPHPGPGQRVREGPGHHSMKHERHLHQKRENHDQMQQGQKQSQKQGLNHST